MISIPGPTSTRLPTILDEPLRKVATLSDETPAGACVVCQHPRRIPNRPPVCDADRTALASMLGEIPDLLARLDVAPNQSGAERVAGSREAPVPVRLDVVDLTGPARAGTVGVRMAGAWSHEGGDPLQVGHLSVATELDAWVQDWRADLFADHSQPVPTVPVLAGWLRHRVDQACDEHPAIDEFARAIRRVHRTLERAVGDKERTGERVGRCPTILRDDTRCGTTLYADPYVSRIGCTRCGTTWSSWLQLAAALEDDEHEGSEAA